MALDDVYRDLLASISGGQIDLYAASQQKPSLTPLRAVLSLFNITASYVVTGAQLDRPGAVTLTGRSTWALAGSTQPSNVSVALVVTSPGGADLFELSLAITDSNWTFSRTFFSLPRTQVYDSTTRTVSYGSSVFQDLPLGRPVLSGKNQIDPSAGPEVLHLAGDLSPVGALAPYQWLFAPWPLRLEGTVTLPATANLPPVLDLTAYSSALRFQVLKATLRNVGLNLVSVNDLDQDTWGVTSFSTINVVATLEVGAIRGDATLVLMPSGGRWRFTIEISPPLSLGNSVDAIAALLDVRPGFLVVPRGFDDWLGFGVSEIEIVLIPPPAGSFAPTVESVAVSLTSEKQWNPPIPFVRVRDVGTRWLIGWTPIGGKQSHYLTGAVFGTVRIGGTQAPHPGTALSARDPDPDPADPPGSFFDVDIVAYIPQFVIQGSLATDQSIPIGDAFRYFFGNPGPPTRDGMAITSFTFSADPASQEYDASAAMTMDWSVPLVGNVTLALQGLRFTITASQGALGGAIVGTFALKSPPGTDDAVAPRFYVGAEYDAVTAPTDGWVFRGGLYPNSTVDLGRLVLNFLGITPPASLPTVALEALSAEFATISKRYHVAGTVAGRWTPTLFGMQVPISAAASVDVRRDAGASQATGRLTGRFAINRIAIEVAIDVGVDKPTYLLRVSFGDLWIQAVTGWRGDPPHQIVTIQLGGVTLGGILEYLVNLAAPTIGFRLEPPWDVLNRIELSRFRLTIDPTERSAELTYDANVNLAIMRIDRIGVKYTRSDGEPAVNLVLYGQFLGKTYGDDHPLSWDVINDPPPSLGGGANSILEVRYLGVGQRVTPRAELPDTIRGTLDLLASVMQPPADPSRNPLSQPTGNGLRFAADSEWLIGIDLSVLDTVDLGVVFNDPRMYGLSVGLRGERAGSFAGLKFEILYKKITDDIGMFRVELALPEAFRHLEFGEVSVTLGVVVIEIYTNGNFLIDLGFPYNRNFDRSFTVEVFPFIGRGGLYFGVLDGSTSRRAPRITNGTFAPVLELGVGLAVGVGKDISVGPLSGGIYVQVEVLFQGVFAWFNPSSNAVAPAKYYWAQAVAAIHGKLYGKVDFVLIKVSVTVEAYAQATITLEAYKPTVFRLDVGVSVEAEVEFLFFSVSFSFDVHLDVSFTVGSERATPWVLDGSGGGAGSGAIARRIEARDRALAREHAWNLRRAGKLRSLGAGAASPCDAYSLVWNPLLRVFTTQESLALTMLPAFSITQVPVDWSGTQPVNPNPQYRVAFLLFAPNGVTPRARWEKRFQRSAASSAQARDVGDLASDTLIEAFLRWSISAITGSPGNDPTKLVTAGQLITLLEQMPCSQTRSAFSLVNLATFFKTNAPLTISGDPGGSPPKQGGMVFPMPPPVQWTSPQAGNRDFSQFNEVGPLYEWGVASYVAPYFPEEAPLGAQPADDPSQYESFATYVFRDYCAMIARAAAKAARDALREWSVTLSAPSTLTGVAASFPTMTISYVVRAGDTVDSVAAALGMSGSELALLNPGLAAALAAAAPGATVPIVLGVGPEGVAIDNAGVTLATTLTFQLGTIDYPVAAGNTLSWIAQHFHLGGAPALVTPEVAADPQLLAPGATFNAPALSFTAPPAASTVLVAAIFYVRYYMPAEIPYADWYSQTVFDLNRDGALRNVREDGVIPPGTILLVPPRLGDPARGDAIPYTTVAGDRVTLIGAALSLAQNFATGDQPVSSWALFRDAVTGTGTVRIPAAPVTIQPRDTLSGLATRTIVNDGQVANLVGWLADANVLQPLAVIEVPGVVAQSGRDGATLGSIASYYALSVADLGRRIAAQTVFQAGQILTLRDLPVQTIDALVARVMGGNAPVDISTTVSRYFLSGLRLPAPVDVQGHEIATGPLTSLYDLTGQQFPGPAPSGPGERLRVVVTLAPGTDWIQLVGSSTVREGEALETLLARAPAARDPRLNAALHPDRVVPGAVVRTGFVSQLIFSYDAAGLKYPATGLAVSPTSPPAAMRLAGTNTRTYGLDHRIALQSGVPLPIPVAGTAAATGVASLWPFPDALLDRARAGVTTPYDVLLSEHGRADAADVVASSTFAATLAVTVRRAASQDDLYDFVGAAPQDRQALLAIWRYLSNGSTPPGTKAFLLVAAAPDAADSSGWTVLDASPTGTYLVKTNLSTETVPGRRLIDATVSDYYASFAELAQFVLLAWEGSTVGGAGYYLRLVTTSGNGIPPGAFDERGSATLQLLVIAGEQQAVAPSGRTLLSINNCAIVAPGLDASRHALYVESAQAQPDPGELVTVATVPPGNIGFTMALPIPAPGTPESQLQALFGTATYEIPAGSFVMPASGLPVGPRRDDTGGQSLPERRRAERRRRLGREAAAVPGTTEWRFDQVIPVTRFGPASAAPATPAAPAVTGLPDASLDPYRGIGGGPLPSTQIQLGFSDVLGNVTAPPSTPSGTVTASVGYTDPIVGVGNWPAVSTSYGVSGGGQGASLTIGIAPQPGAWIAAPASSPSSAIGAAARIAARYRDPYFQLIQPGVGVSAVTTLAAQPIPVDVPTLWRYAAAMCAATTAASSLIAAKGNGTLGGLVTTFGVTYDEIAAANVNRPIAELLGNVTLSIPVFRTFAAGDTANGIVESLKPGWPNPGSGQALLTANATLPLRPGAALAIPSAAITVPTPAPTLAALAENHYTTAPFLALDSQVDRDLLTPGFTFVFDGISIAVEGNVNTLADVIAAFAAQGVIVTAEDIGSAYAGVANMIVAGKTAHTAHYLSVDGDTLALNHSGVSLAQLAQDNAGTPDVFDAGGLLILGTVSASSSSGAALETLGEFAARYTCPPGPLLAANPGLTLPVSSILELPGTTTFPTDATQIRIPYRIGAGDSLNLIATRFTGSTAQTLGADNRYIPGTIAAGQTITVGGQSTSTIAGDSFQSVWQRLHAQSGSITFQDVIQAIAPTGGYLAAGALLVAPPAALPGSGNQTPDAVAAVYQLDAVTFARANASVLGLIASGVTLYSPDGAVTVTTGASDTFNSIVSRFAQAHVIAGVDAIVTRNHDVAFLIAGARALLPPAPIALAASLGPTIGPFSNPINPLSVALRIQRPDAVIDPAFRTPGQDGPVERADAPVAPGVTLEGQSAGQELTLEAFVDAFQSVFPSLRVASGKVAGAHADLWFVDFSATGITRVAVAPGVTGPGGAAWPRFFALRPLYNALVERPGVPIRSLADDGTLSPTSTPTDFHDVDVDVWARRFLADVDLILSAPYAAAIYASVAARPTLDLIMAAKKLLAAAVARGIAATLVLADPRAAAGRTAAIRALEQQLDASLSSAYAIDALVQYDATVDSPWTRGAPLLPARLAGSAVALPPTAPPTSLPYTMQGAKTALDAASSFVTFSLRVADPRHEGAVPVNLTYELLDLEFDIQSVAGIQGYVSSSWCSFVERLQDGSPPAIHTALGASTVPIPLRNFPALPTIVGQTAGPSWSWSTPPPLDQTPLWTYGLTYTHEHAAQDEVEVTVSFNVMPEPRAARWTDVDDVATALAKYIAVADPLWKLLSAFTDPATTIPPTTLANAAATFAGFASAIASAWNTRWPATDEATAAAPADNPIQQTYALRARMTYAVNEGKTYFSTLELTRDQALPGPGGQWPNVYYDPPQGPRVPLTSTPPTGATAVYAFPTAPAIEAIDWPHVTIEWPNLGVASLQNARGSAAVRRNAKLLGETGPDTAPDFIYRTGRVSAEIVTPLLVWSDELMLAGSDVATALGNAFAALFGNATGLPLTIAIMYGYTLVPPVDGDPGITVYLPVSIYPSQPLSSGTAAAVAAAIAAWDRVYAPTHAGGRWAFALTLYSQVDTATARPLLSLERLVFPIPS